MEPFWSLSFLTIYKVVAERAERPRVCTSTIQFSGDNITTEMDSRASTPIMEDNELDFQQVPPRNYPLSLVALVQDTLSAPQPAASAFRLPSPYLTFNASWPLPNVPLGPRAFIRSSMVFQPMTGQFCPLSSATTSHSLSDGNVSDASSTTPVNTPRFPGQ